MDKKKKFKIVSKAQKESRNDKSFRLFDFQTYDKNKKFRIQMFGINEKGETCAIFIDDYQPFFYTKLPTNWKEHDMQEWFHSVKKQCKYAQNVNMPINMYCVDFSASK